MTAEQLDLTSVEESIKQTFFEQLVERIDDEITVSDQGVENREKIEKRWKETICLIPQLEENATNLKNDIVLGIKTFNSYDSLMQNEIYHYFDSLDDSFAIDIVSFLASAKAKKGGKSEVTSEIAHPMVQSINTINKDWTQISSLDLVKAAILGNL